MITSGMKRHWLNNNGSRHTLRNLQHIRHLWAAHLALPLQRYGDWTKSDKKHATFGKGRVKFLARGPHGFSNDWGKWLCLADTSTAVYWQAMPSIQPDESTNCHILLSAWLLCIDIANQTNTTMIFLYQHRLSVINQLRYRYWMAMWCLKYWFIRSMKAIL